MSEKKVITDDLTLQSEKKTRTPKQAESITAGAVKLTLQQKVDLVKVLKESINAEVEQAAKTHELAKATVNGL